MGMSKKLEWLQYITNGSPRGKRSRPWTDTVESVAKTANLFHKKKTAVDAKVRALSPNNPAITKNK